MVDLGGEGDSGAGLDLRVEPHHSSELLGVDVWKGGARNEDEILLRQLLDPHGGEAVEEGAR